MTRPVPTGAAPEAADPTPTTASFGHRVAGILRQPRLTFAQIVRRPDWALVLLISTLVGAGAGAGLMTTAVGRQALVDQWEQTATAFGQVVDDRAYAELERLSEQAAVGYAVLSALISIPVLALAIAGVVWLVFRGARFTQVLAVTSYASVILALRQVVAAPLGYLRESTASATSLGGWFPDLDAASPIARFLGALDLFVIWWAVVLAIGVAVLYRRRPQTVAATFVGVYAALALLLAIAMAVAGSTA